MSACDHEIAALDARLKEVEAKLGIVVAAPEVENESDLYGQLWLRLYGRAPVRDERVMFKMAVIRMASQEFGLPVKAPKVS